MSRRLAACAFALSAAVAVAASAQVPAQEDFAEVEAFARRHFEAAGFPGMAVVITRGGEIAHIATFGDAGPGGRALTADTPMMIGSVSKSITAVAVMHLADRGRLDLHDRVVDIIPWFTLADGGHAAEITLLDLLNHTSGIPASAGYQPILGVDLSEGALEAHVRSLATVVPSGPRGHFEYSNANYNLLGFVVETVSGQGFADFVTSRVFDGLGMAHSHADAAAARADGVATGHRRWFSVPVAAEDIPIAPAWTASAFLAVSPRDMGRYMAFLLSRDAAGSGVLPALAIDALFEGGAEIPGEQATFYSKGWIVRTAQGMPVYWHNGDIGHFHSEVVLNPQTGTGVAILVNDSPLMQAARFEELAMGTMALLHGKTPRPLDGPHRILATVYWGFLAIPLLQALGLARAARRNAPRRGPVRRWLAPAVNVLLTVALVFGAANLFGDAAPLLEIVYMMPDIGLMLLVSVLASLGWLVLRARRSARPVGEPG